MTAEEIIELRQRRYNATAVYLKLVNPDLMILRVKPDFPRPAHHTGQYCTLGKLLGRRTEGADGGAAAGGNEVVRRAYSIVARYCPSQLMKLEDNGWSSISSW